MVDEFVISTIRKYLSQFEFDDAAKAVEGLRLISNLDDEDLARLSVVLEVTTITLQGLVIAARGACRAADDLYNAGQLLEQKALNDLVLESRVVDSDLGRAAGARFLLSKVKGWRFKDD